VASSAHVAQQLCAALHFLQGVSMATKRKKARAAAAKGGRRVRAAKPGPIPDVIYAQASPHSLGGLSMFSANADINASTVANYRSEADLVRRSVSALQEAGFSVLQVSPQSINIAGSKKLFEAAFGATIVAEERSVIKPGGPTTATFLECPQTDLPGLLPTKSSRFADLLEGVAIEEPRYFMATSMFPPQKAYWHLDVPAGVSLGCNADKAHRGGGRQSAR
jgi:hypothetical protein